MKSSTRNINLLMCSKKTDQPFSMNAKYSKILTFLNPSYANVSVRNKGVRNVRFSKYFVYFEPI